MDQTLEFFGSDARVASLEEALRETDSPQRRESVAALAWMLRERDPARALALATEVLAAQPAPSPSAMTSRSTARSTLVCGYAQWLADRPQAALALMAEARHAFEAIRDAAGAGDAWLLQSRVHDAQGEQGPGDEARAEAASAYLEAADALRACLAHLCAVRAWALRDVEEGERCLDAALQDTDLVDQPGIAASAETARGVCHVARGNWPAAAAGFERAARLAIEAGALHTAATSAVNAAHAHLHLADPSNALEWSTLAAGIARARSMRGVAAAALICASDSMLRLGDAAAADRQAVEAVALLAPQPRCAASMLAWCAAGKAAVVLGDYKRALTAFDTAAEIAQQWDDPAIQAECAAWQARTLSHQGRVAEAMAVAARALRSSKQATERAGRWQLRRGTERARAEAAQLQALAQAQARRADAELQANRAKSAFLANMSHELRTPLHSMLGFTRLLLRNPALREGYSDLSIVLRSGEHLSGLINQVLEMSKIEAGHISLVETEFDLHAMLEELRGMFVVAARDKSIALAVDFDASLPRYVRADITKLRQVLTNLLGNAVKFTQRGSVALRACMDGERLRFEVSDTGAGIAREALAGLGQAFVQGEGGRRAAEGTGLGLAISRGFVHLMGGELELASERGEGLRANFSIPLQRAEAALVEAARVAAAAQVTGLAPGTPPQRVLVVDDRKESRLLLKRLIEPLGFQVREAANGREAIKVWEEWSPQLVLMDMRMPVMDGMEATRRIRATEAVRCTVIVAVTASSFEEEREEILAAGCDDFLRKPVLVEELLGTMARHLGVRLVGEGDQAHADAMPDTDDPRLAGLVRLPEAVRAQLRQSLERLDVRAVERAIAALRQHDAAAADVLEPLVGRFQYERIRALIP